MPLLLVRGREVTGPTVSRVHTNTSANYCSSPTCGDSTLCMEGRLLRLAAPCSCHASRAFPRVPTGCLTLCGRQVLSCTAQHTHTHTWPAGHWRHSVSVWRAMQTVVRKKCRRERLMLRGNGSKCCYIRAAGSITKAITNEGASSYFAADLHAPRPRAGLHRPSDASTPALITRTARVTITVTTQGHAEWRDNVVAASVRAHTCAHTSRAAAASLSVLQRAGPHSSCPVCRKNGSSGLPMAYTTKPTSRSRAWSRVLQPSKTNAGLAIVS